MNKLTGYLILLAIFWSPAILAVEGQPVTVNIKRLSLDTALAMANAAIAQCRKEGVQVAVTIVDRGGHPQVVLRDVLAMDLTLEISKQKAYTAMSFNTPTGALKERGAMPIIDGILPANGGIPINAGGTILGGIGVSGAPSGETDHKCAQAGIDAIIDDLEMESN